MVLGLAVAFGLKAVGFRNVIVEGAAVLVVGVLSVVESQSRRSPDSGPDA